MSTIPSIIPPHTDKVVVKWQGKKFDIDLDTAEPGSTFKLQVFSLTGVPPERQKVLIKGGQLKDDQDMATLSLKPGHAFMLIGTAEQGFKAPEKKTLFLEDMSAAEMAKSVCSVITGLM
jgi:ubiquitin carboxyl-terminal hydrolase 14